MYHESEPVSIKVKCIELNFLWMNDRLIGSFELTMGENEPIIYIPMDGGETLGYFDKYLSFVYRKEEYPYAHTYYTTYATPSFDYWFMVGLLETEREVETHILLVSEDGNMSQAVQEMELLVQAYLEDGES